MAKLDEYDALGDYLLAQDASQIAMTFSQIEAVIGRTLPKSAKYPAWWSNNPSNNAMTQVWLKAGFKTEQVDIGGRKLVFRRTIQPKAPAEQPGGLAEVSRGYRAPKAVPAETAAGCRHPLYGALQGYIRIAPEIDLTAPPDPEWGERIWGGGQG